MTGWVKLHRALLDSWVWKLPDSHLRVAIGCLLCTRWKSGGTFECTQRDLADDCGVSKSTLLRALTALEKGGFLAVEADHKRTMITITNFERYQGRESEGGPQVDHERTTADKTYLLCKKGKKERIPPKSPKGDAADTAAWFVSEFNRVLGRSVSVAPWLKSVDRALKAGHTRADMHAALFFAAGWPDEIRSTCSPKTLLKLQSSQGKLTLPEYADRGREAWREERGAAVPPWERETLRVVKGGRDE